MSRTVRFPFGDLNQLLVDTISDHLNDVSWMRVFFQALNAGLNGSELRGRGIQLLGNALATMPEFSKEDRNCRYTDRRKAIIFWATSWLPDSEKGQLYRTLAPAVFRVHAIDKDETIGKIWVGAVAGLTSTEMVPFVGGLVDRATELGHPAFPPLLKRAGEIVALAADRNNMGDSMKGVLAGQLLSKLFEYHIVPPTWEAAMDVAVGATEGLTLHDMGGVLTRSFSGLPDVEELGPKSYSEERALFYRVAMRHGYTMTGVEGAENFGEMIRGALEESDTNKSYYAQKRVFLDGERWNFLSEMTNRLRENMEWFGTAVGHATRFLPAALRGEVVAQFSKVLEYSLEDRLTFFRLTCADIREDRNDWYYGGAFANAVAPLGFTGFVRGIRSIAPEVSDKDLLVNGATFYFGKLRTWIVRLAVR